MERHSVTSALEAELIVPKRKAMYYIVKEVIVPKRNAMNFAVKELICLQVYLCPSKQEYTTY
jgi:hypothetical protein